MSVKSRPARGVWHGHSLGVAPPVGRRVPVTALALVLSLVLSLVLFRAAKPERPRARAHTGKTNQQARNHRAIAPTSQRASWLCRATRRISRSAEHIVQKSSTRPSTVIREAQMTVSGFIRRPVRSRWYETGPMSAAAVAEPSITVTT